MRQTESSRRRSRAALWIAAVLLCSLAAGCGGVRFVQSDEEAGNFHPATIGILPAEVGIYTDAAGKVDGILADLVSRTKWFQRVVGGDEIQKAIAGNEELKNSLDVYVAKLRELNYSDPELCKVISELCGIQALLIPTVDVWEYTMHGNDKIARVGLSMRLVDTRTGKTVWRAGHQITDEYWFLKPELTDVGKRAARMMIDRMPH